MDISFLFFFILFGNNNKKNVRIIQQSTHITSYHQYFYTYLYIRIFIDFVPAALEPCPQFVEPLEQLRRSFQSQRRECEYFHVALD